MEMEIMNDNEALKLKVSWLIWAAVYQDQHGFITR